jgi:competence ComEA-like helix-hairpin-helix protein
MYWPRLKDGKGKKYSLISKKSLQQRLSHNFNKLAFFFLNKLYFDKKIEMNLNQFAREYFNFSRKERLGIFTLLTLLLAAFPAPYFFAFISKPNQIQKETGTPAEILQLEAKQANINPPGKNQPLSEDENEYRGLEGRRPLSNPNSAKELFYFDPNTLTHDGWERIGLRNKTIQTIQNYLAKGGHFYKPEDLKKIYGLHPEEFERLKPYIKIEENTIASIRPVNENISSEKQPVKSFVSKYKPVDINNSDTTEWIALPGIGSKLANRIVNFREKLGGFYSTEQIKEVYALPDSTFQKIKPLLLITTFTVKKININLASKEEMKAHPYIRWNLANAIEAYRKMHGNYEDIADLKKIVLINEEVFEKIKSYVTVTE